jgi:hypothetical protein
MNPIEEIYKLLKENGIDVEAASREGLSKVESELDEIIKTSAEPLMTNCKDHHDRVVSMTKIFISALRGKDLSSHDVVAFASILTVRAVEALSQPQSNNQPTSFCE